MKDKFYDRTTEGTLRGLVEHYRREVRRLEEMTCIRATVKFDWLPEYYQSMHVSKRLVEDSRQGEKFVAAFAEHFSIKFARSFAIAVHKDRPDWSSLLPVPAILHCPTCNHRHICNEMCKASKYMRHMCNHYWGQCDYWKAGTLNLIGVKELP